MSNNWSESEVKAVVEDYFNMLLLELTDRKYNKTEYRRALMTRLNHRSGGSIEMKHQNISAVLIEMGIPYIDGYKPLSNYQRSLLPPVIANYLRNNSELQMLFLQDSEAIPQIPSVSEFLAVMEEPPTQVGRPFQGIAEAPAIYNPAGVNYLEKEAQNQNLGDAGEQFVINFERARLIRAGKESLADRIEHVAVSVGPSAGFDIRSFEESGSDRFIEAKTTKYGKNTPFFVTPNELRFSRENPSCYFLYRIFKFRTEPRMFTLHGHLQDRCNLEPSQYIAKPA